MTNSLDMCQALLWLVLFVSVRTRDPLPKNVKMATKTSGAAYYLHLVYAL